MWFIGLKLFKLQISRKKFDTDKDKIGQQKWAWFYLFKINSNMQANRDLMVGIKNHVDYNILTGLKLSKQNMVIVYSKISKKKLIFKSSAV